MQVVAELVKALVKENASTIQSQETYLKRYEDLTKRYEKAADSINGVEQRYMDCYGWESNRSQR